MNTLYFANSKKQQKQAWNILKENCLNNLLSTRSIKPVTNYLPKCINAAGKSDKGWKWKIKLLLVTITHKTVIRKNNDIQIKM